MIVFLAGGLGGGAGADSGSFVGAGGGGLAVASGFLLAPPNLEATSLKSLSSMYAAFLSSTICAITANSLAFLTLKRSSLLSCEDLLTRKTKVFALLLSILLLISCLPYTKVSFSLFCGCQSMTFSLPTISFRGIDWLLFTLYTSTSNSFLIGFGFLPSSFPKKPTFFMEEGVFFGVFSFLDFFEAFGVAGAGEAGCGGGG